jgi:hypothetical protein
LHLVNLIFLLEIRQLLVQTLESLIVVLQGLLAHRGKRGLADSIIIEPVVVNKLVARNQIAGFRLPSRSHPRLAISVLVYDLEYPLPLVTNEAPINLDTDRVIIGVSGHQRGLARDLEKRQLILYCELSAV